MSNKYTDLLKKSSTVSLKVDFTTIHEIINFILTKKVGFNMSKNFLLYSDEESYSMAIKILEENLTTKELEKLGDFRTDEDFLNMDFAMQEYFKDLDIHPHSISVVSLNNDINNCNLCEIFISNKENHNV